MTDAPTPRDVIAKGFPLDWSLAARESAAGAILSALTAAGYVVVPREPTNEMVAAGAAALSIDRAIIGELPAHLMFLSDGATGCYHAMIAAASPLPAGPIAEGEGT